MNLRRYCLFLLTAPVCLAQISPGSGAPNEFFRIRFLNAYYRNGFDRLVSAATTNVAKFGGTGLNQEFSDISNLTGTRYAMVRANLNMTVPDNDMDVFQVYPLIYGTYKGGVTTYGYPTTDTLGCSGALDPTCQYQLFDKNYALFGYNPALFAGQIFAVRDPYYTRWGLLGGINRLGPANTAETAVTSSVSVSTATMQGFSVGAIYNITSGVLSGRLYGVRNPIYGVYAQYNAHAGYLGYPAGEELLLANGNYRQSFEGGAIDYDPVTQSAFLRPGVKYVNFAGDVPAPVKLNVGDGYTATVQVTSVAGDLLTDRTVNWLSTNGKVVSVLTTGYTATFKAVGAGTASVTAVVDGKSSAAIQFIVASLCCQIGEGASNASTQQIFRDAATRNKLNLTIPTAAPVQRAGNGYFQEFISATSDAAPYDIALPDQSATAWILTGPILSRYLELGGFTGTLGYPSADPTPGGRQMFTNGALAGLPVQVVTAPVLARWAVAGYETGPLGSPSAAAASFQTFTTASGIWQPFSKANVYSLQSGAQAGRSYSVGGLILAKYSTSGGHLGNLGAPIGDEIAQDNNTRQEFEGGTISYLPGATEASVTLRPRTPAVDSTPAVVSAGSRVHIRVSGFADGSTLRVSVTNQPDFMVQTSGGAYAWDVYLPPNSASGTVTVRAATPDGKTSATGTFLVRSAVEAKLQVSIVDGNNQVVSPGAVLPRPLKVVVLDSSKNPIAGVPLTFDASPGAQILSSSSLTGSAGDAQATLRMPVSAGAVLVTARIASGTAVFQALATSSTLSGFPRLMQSGSEAIGDGNGTIANQGAMLSATASILRYYQNRGTAGSPLGLADPAALNRYLTTFCTAGAQGGQLCDGYLTPSPGSPERIVNLWRLSGFAGANIDAIPGAADLAVVRDGLGSGGPVLLTLSLLMDGAPAGSHYVVAIGVADDGGIFIHDPSPVLSQASLADYLNGFSVGGHAYKATLSSVVAILPRTASGSGFLVVSNNAPISGNSAAGSCGATFETPANSAVPGIPSSSQPATFRAMYCDGQMPFYQVESSSTDSYRMSLIDLGTEGSRTELGGGGEAAFKVVKSGVQWTAAPEDVSFTASSVVNAATFQPGVSPGGLMAIFGTGLARASGKTQVDVAGQPAVVIAATPFQINAQVPPQTAIGAQPVTVRSPYGSLQQPVEVRSVAPGIFILSGRQGAVVNQDGSINSSFNPLPRGQVLVIYCTGLGAVAKQGAYQVAQSPVAAALQGKDLQTAYAGLTPGFVGLYQVNVTVPADLPPGLDVPLFLRQESTQSNSVDVSIQ